MSKEMNRREFLKVTAATGAVITTGNTVSSFAQELQPIQLPKPQAGWGETLDESVEGPEIGARIRRREAIPAGAFKSALGGIRRNPA
jgi:hypothetical protein